MDQIECGKCKKKFDKDCIDTSDTKEVFQGTDMSWGYLDVFSEFAKCPNCKEYAILVKVTKKQSKGYGF